VAALSIDLLIYVNADNIGRTLKKNFPGPSRRTSSHCVMTNEIIIDS